MPALWLFQMKVSVAGNRNNEVVKRGGFAARGVLSVHAASRRRGGRRGYITGGRGDKGLAAATDPGGTVGRGPKGDGDRSALAKGGDTVDTVMEQRCGIKPVIVAELMCNGGSVFVFETRRFKVMGV
ncbi:hypothetical protein AAFF_G00363660 [Aldrovandia affinis]|uniref:Uncharacterized protein n=1 Tax=Aldrovandia affinis TaxID=143900 RepID=A0AAD7SHG5_9TELE|nr:hypothetical protein AAFF_G00363660 [Aldrovandia affinis]